MKQILIESSLKIDADTSGFTVNAPGNFPGPKDGVTGPLDLGRWKTADSLDVIDFGTGEIVSASGATNLPLANETTSGQAFFQVLNPPASWKEGMVVQIGTGADIEIRAIEEINGSGGLKTIAVRPLLKPHTAGTLVKQGLVAEKSGWYGYGRIDASIAVKKALAYSHDDRDLMIRDFEGDLGTGSTNPFLINSPDLWFRMFRMAKRYMRTLLLGKTTS